MSNDLYLSDTRYLAALKRILNLIIAGLKLEANNSDITGDKHNECSWGLCSDQIQAWPDSDDHLWPDQFFDYGRVVPKYREFHQRCPLDKRTTAELTHNGCFWTCFVFQSRHHGADRDQVIKWYKSQIAETEQRIATSAMEHEEEFK